MSTTTSMKPTMWSGCSCQTASSSEVVGDRQPPQVQHVNKGFEVAGYSLSHVVGRVVAFAVPPQIEGQDVEPVGHLLREGIPASCMTGVCVQEDQWRSLRAPPVSI